jgi:multidomain signaling protein FimX
MQSSDTFHLLISCGAQSQLDSCLALFRDAGHNTRAHRVASLRDLGDALRDQRWDLLIADDNHPELRPAQVLELLRERANDVPCIVRTAEPNAAQSLDCLALGACDVIAATDGVRLLSAARRDIAALREHRQLAELRTRYDEVAHRVELLLAASQDAIAYVVDGMHIHANSLYAERFGYAGVDELAAVPLVDLIATDNQQQFKGALRRYRDHPEEQTAIDFAGLRSDGGTFAGRLILSTASFEGEPCMQVLVRTAPAAVAPTAPAAAAIATAEAVESSRTEATPNVAAATGITALSAALDASPTGNLLLISLDSYALHVRNLGAVNADRLVHSLADYLAKIDGWAQPPLRVADSVLAVVLPDTDSENVALRAQRMIEQTTSHIHVLGTRSATCSICIAVCPLGQFEETVDASIDRCFGALAAVADAAERLRGNDPARMTILRVEKEPPAAAPIGAAEGLQRAIQSSDFRVLFQPIVSLRGDSSEHYEVRVIHAPSQLSAAAWMERSHGTGGSIEFDQWAITEICAKLAAHRASRPNTRLILSISAASIVDPDFIGWLAGTLRSAALPADSIVIQMSHRDIASRLREAKLHVERLRGMGCQVAISAIHGANNPIADLAHLKPQFARLDDELADALIDHDATNTLIKPLIEALHQEQIASVVPNVQSAGALAVLWQLGVHFIQGDYLQPPAAEMHYEFSDLA